MSIEARQNAYRTMKEKGCNVPLQWSTDQEALDIFSAWYKIGCPPNITVGWAIIAGRSRFNIVDKATNNVLFTEGYETPPAIPTPIPEPPSQPVQSIARIRKRLFKCELCRAATLADSGRNSLSCIKSGCTGEMR